MTKRANLIRAITCITAYVLAVVGVFGCTPSTAAADPNHKVELMSLNPNTTCGGSDYSEQLTRLSPEQYRVTQEQGTEAPFRNAYWNHHEAGIYVDVVSGEPLFSSLDKFDSGTGWPSFTKPINAQGVTRKSDASHGMSRSEVRSAKASSHLGHVFDDGPGPTGERFCINSAALRFIPASRLAAEGYASLEPLFAESKAKETSPTKEERATATFAAGCFWGVQDILRKIPGVRNSEVGYTGGTPADPTYNQVSTGRTGHAEAIQIVFDPRVLSYDDLLRTFFRLHDPTTKDRQGHDTGSQYRSAIFYHDESQREAAERIKDEVAHSGKWKDKIVTEIVPATKFYRAEDYHQDYLVKHPGGYTCHYLRD